MKSFYLIAAFSGKCLQGSRYIERKEPVRLLLTQRAAFSSIEAATVSTVICSGCQPVSSTPDIVTRSPLPSTSCTAPVLTAVFSMPTSITMHTNSAAPSSSVMAVTAGGSNIVCGISGALALAAAAVYLA